LTGYYLMHRGWLDNSAFPSPRREPYCPRSAWAWLIEHAQYEATKARIAGKLVELQRGQLSYSYRYLGEAWGWQHDRCRRLVAVLSQAGMIATDTATGQLIITICNYDKYQVQPNGLATVGASALRQRRDSAATNKKEGNKGNESSPSGSKDPSGEGSPRGSRLPADLDEIPPDWAEAAIKARGRLEMPEINLALEWEKFKNHWGGQAGQAARKTNWKKTWINWALKATPPWTRPSLNLAGKYDPGYVPPTNGAGPTEPPPRPQDLWPEDYPEEARH